MSIDIEELRRLHYNAQEDIHMDGGDDLDEFNQAAWENMPALLDEIERLRNENFSLAANQCHSGYGDEGGNHRCKYQDGIERLRGEIKAAVEAERKAIIDILEKAKTGKYKSESAIEAIRARWSK